MTEPRPLADLCETVGELNGLTLRPWQVGDAEQLSAAWADPEIARWNAVPSDSSVEFARSWISGASTQTSVNRVIDAVAVKPERPDEIVGEVGLQIDRRQRLGELGFWVASPHRRQGHARTVIGLGLLMAKALDLRGAVAMVEPDNEVAQATLLSASWTEIPATGTRLAFAARCE